ncbi:hypothetical protein O3P69_019095 [Scylla paramamosain]|uniref:Uncharacterized protein n=1 Tax=Scylla paramamosain TaxID=85552 RepID=A0AAW0SAN3_SCYPA
MVVVQVKPLQPLPDKSSTLDLNQHLPASLTPAVVPGSAEARAATTLREGEREDSGQRQEGCCDTRSSSISDGERWTVDEYYGSHAFFRITSDPPILVVAGVRQKNCKCMGHTAVFCV